MSFAAAPTKGGEHITINFGLVAVPIVVLNGIDEGATAISRNLYTPDGNRVSMRTVDSETGTEYARNQLIKRYTTDDGVVIDLSDEEIAGALAAENGTSELIGVYPLTEVSVYRAAGPVQVRPQTLKQGTKTIRLYDKVYALFFGALADAGSFALVRYVSRGKPKLLVLFGDGTGQWVHWANEVRAEAPKPHLEISDKEREAATMLLETFTYSTADPIPNEAVEAVKAYAELKAKGAGPVSQEQIVPVAAVPDLMALLLESLPKGVKV